LPGNFKLKQLKISSALRSSTIASASFESIIVDDDSEMVARINKQAAAAKLEQSCNGFADY